MYVNKCVKKLKYGTNIRLISNGIEFTQSHLPEEVISDPYTSVNQALCSGLCLATSAISK